MIRSTPGPASAPKRLRLAIVTSHPIQYQAPLFRELARRPEVDLTVFFCSDHGLREAFDSGFGQTFKWDMPLLEGYAYEFVPNRSPRPGVQAGFWGEVNPGLVTRLSRGKFDAVLVHGYAYASSWLAFAGARLGRAALLMRMESHLLEPRARWKQGLKRLLLGPVLRSMDQCVPIGSLNHEYYRHYGVSPLRLTYSPYAVDEGLFRSESEHMRHSGLVLRRSLGLPETRPVVLFCAKLSPVKRPLDFLAALAACGGETRPHGLVVGDGVLRGECEWFAKEHLAGCVTFAGFQNQAAIPRFYAAADLLVLPSGREPWGLVINEAMAAGLPVITTTVVGAAPDLVRHGETGFVFPVGDVPLLARLIQQALDPMLLPRLAQNARARIERWSLQRSADGIVSAAFAASASRQPSWKTHSRGGNPQTPIAHGGGTPLLPTDE